MDASTIYIKAAQSAQVCNRKIFIKDVLEVYSADAELQKKAGNIILYTVKGDKNEKIVFSIIKIMDCIQKELGRVPIESLGEPDFIVEYKMPIRPKKGAEYAKLLLLSVIIFIGAAFTIMTFNTDVSVGDVFDNLTELITGEEKKEIGIMECAYSVGILSGVLAFYNHFRADKLHSDPTPIHIEMRNYEEEMNKAIMKEAEREGKVLK